MREEIESNLWALPRQHEQQKSRLSFIDKWNLTKLYYNFMNRNTKMA